MLEALGGRERRQAIDQDPSRVRESGTGRRATIEELYTRGQLLDELIPELLELQERYNIETYFADPSEPAYIEHCRRMGLRITEATNDVPPGIDAVAASLKAGETVSPRCTGLLAEILDYTWQRDRSGEERERWPVALNNDACDAWRYAHMGLDAEAETEYILVYDDPVEISRY